MGHFFETERLLVRGFEATDLDDFAALMADAEVVRFMDEGQTLPRDVVERWIGVCHEKYATRGYGTSAVFERSTGRFVGLCGVIRAPEHEFDELIYALGRDFWGQGYATEVSRAMVEHVFGLSDLDRIWATIYAENAPTKRVLAKVGFHFDHTESSDGHVTEFWVLSRPAAV